MLGVLYFGRMTYTLSDHAYVPPLTLSARSLVTAGRAHVGWLRPPGAPRRPSRCQRPRSQRWLLPAACEAAARPTNAENRLLCGSRSLTGGSDTPHCRCGATAPARRVPSLAAAATTGPAALAIMGWG